ncbi:MAG: ADP-ribosylation factor-like protein, partial [Candidatus Hodarchaeota archaeon]
MVDFEEVPFEIKTLVKEDYIDTLTDKATLSEQEISILRGFSAYHSSHLRDSGIIDLKTFAGIDDELLRQLSDEIGLDHILMRQKRAAALILCKWATDDLPMPPLKRIIITGLDYAGKTCTIQTLQNMQPHLKTSPTKGFLRETMSFLNYDLHLFDLGGQLTFREMYADEPELYFSKAMGLIYVIDVQTQKRMNEAVDYLREVVEDAIKLNDNLVISIHMHKIDTPNPQLLGTASHLEMKIKATMQELGVEDYKIYHTSVLRLETLVNAFSSLVGRL